MHDVTMLACHRCDALQRVPIPQPGQSAFCGCCGARFFRYPRGGLAWPLALILAALILFIVANLFPLVSLDIGGLNQDATLLGTAVALYQHGEKMVGVLVFLITIVVPASIMLSTLYVLVDVRHRLRLPGTRRLLVFISHLHPWEMG
ncbi:MAG TPA: paraquat-inducible protein A, partial [Chromatiaceae bacterium]|nr:paraquat-inducible protein A [Chromatiaceae bacterium]